MKLTEVLKKIGMTFLFPVLVYLIMFIVVRSQGITYFGLNGEMWRTIIVNTSMTSVVALAIWLQIKNGRFDFSGGAVMLLSGIIAGNITIKFNQGPVMLLVYCVVIATLLSLIAGIIYVVGRLPIIICTIGVAMIYESLTYLVFDARGLNIMSNTKLTVFGTLPWIIVILAVAVLIFTWFNYFTVEGRRALLLAKNQQASVQIGINEVKNVLFTFLVCGILLGLAATLYASQNSIKPQSGLSTAGTFFAYIIPAYMGMVVGMASKDVIGVVLAALGMEILNYGLNCLGVGAGGYQQIIMGIFMLSFYGFTARFDKIRNGIINIIRRDPQRHQTSLKE